MLRGCIFVAVVSLGMLVPSHTSAGLVFNYTLGTELDNLQGTNPTLAADVIAGFEAAGDLWSAILTDNVEINIVINYAALGPGILGSADTDTVTGLYSAVSAALAADATSPADALAVANLTPGAELSFLTNNRAGSVILDDDDSVNNIALDVNRANAKALGLLAAADPGTDASITFSSNFAFDFNASNGISPGTFDFVGIAAHEIGHSLGFVSGVDAVDRYSGAGPNAGVDLNGALPGIGTIDPFRVFSVLDLYRYSGAGVRNLAFGGTPYFSLDGGTTNQGLFSTGRFNGDGRQASHWKDGLGLGIMDPTLASGELGLITARDVLAFDAIGWNLNLSASAVPEPSTLAMLGLGAIGLVSFRRRKTGDKTSAV